MTEGLYEIRFSITYAVRLNTRLAYLGVPPIVLLCGRSGGLRGWKGELCRTSESLPLLDRTTVQCDPPFISIFDVCDSSITLLLVLRGCTKLAVRPGVD